MKHLKPINEIFTGTPIIPNNSSKSQKDFLKFASNYVFVDYYYPSERIDKKFFGLKYGETEKTSETKQEIKYNDLTFNVSGDDIMVQSGNHGTYRPEGYAYGGSGSDESIYKRIQQLVSDFNRLNGNATLMPYLNDNKYTVRLND